MYWRKLVFFFISYLFCSSGLHGQHVTVSPEISIRNNVAYDIIGRIDDRILFYRDKGNERAVLLYDNNLVFQSERQINLDEKRCYLYEVINLDTAFAIIYGYRHDGHDVTKMDIFSSGAERLDSITLTNEERKWKGLNFESVLSEDESKLALFNVVNNDQIRIIVIDIQNKDVLTDDEFTFPGINLYDDIVELDVSNRGSFYMLTEKNNYKSKKKHHIAQIYEFSPGLDKVHEIIVPLDDLVCQDLTFSINNKDNTIGIAGLYDDKRMDESTGYFWLSGNNRTFESQEIELIPFNDEIYFEVYGERNKGRMENFRIAEIIWKANGTPIITLEMSYDISRRTGSIGYVDQTYNGYGRSSGGAPAWSDHYRDDLILISLDEKGKQEWHQVFYKKQFSQNDNAVFSSFFPFITPSRLRLIYNDEIKNNSTVSEYILDGSGNYKRTSVLSTEYQNLRLRFADAHQISPTELLVPSQKNYSVNIVKIDFTQ